MSAVTRTSMFVTRDTSQLLMSSLKEAQAALQSQHQGSVHPEYAQNTFDRSVTCETSHVLMWS